MRKILFITFANKQQYTGGGQGTKRNMYALEKLFGKENFHTYIIPPRLGKRNLSEKWQKVIDIFHGRMGGLTAEAQHDILNLIAKGAFTDLFIDSSLLGQMAKHVKKQFPHLNIYTYFQNIEIDFITSNIRDGKEYVHAYWIPMTRYNERCACRYSNKVITLNDRDSRRLHLLYGRKEDGQIPVWMMDDYTPPTLQKPTTSDKKHKALFVGSYFFGNTQGLAWFCQEVLPETNIHLTIVGSGMDAFANDITMNSDIEIYSNVPDLTPFYENADFVILPITTGGGMKVKTAETLKYGKYIIGTQEALEGYDVNPEIAAICCTKEDFIHAIQQFDRPYKFNAPSRSLFREKYEYEAIAKRYQSILMPDKE